LIARRFSDSHGGATPGTGGLLTAGVDCRQQSPVTVRPMGENVEGGGMAERLLGGLLGGEQATLDARTQRDF